MDITIPNRKNTLLAITVLLLPDAPKLPEYPATAPRTAKLQTQVNTLTTPNRKTAAKTIIPACSALNAEFIHSFIFSLAQMVNSRMNLPVFHNFLQAQVANSMTELPQFHSLLRVRTWDSMILFR
jgi:hypothetical protein